MAAAAGAGGAPNEPRRPPGGGVLHGLGRHRALQALPHLHQPLRHLDRRRQVRPLFISAVTVVLLVSPQNAVATTQEVTVLTAFCEWLMLLQGCRNCNSPLPSSCLSWAPVHKIHQCCQQPMHAQGCKVHVLTLEAAMMQALHLQHMPDERCAGGPLSKLSTLLSRTHRVPNATLCCAAGASPATCAT